jgi:hypothetical protein
MKVILSFAHRRRHIGICHKVSDALVGWELYGDPTYAFDHASSCDALLVSRD